MDERLAKLSQILTNGLSFSQIELGPTVIQTNWITLTGAPGSGKSTICQILKEQGYTIVPEMSRMLIEQALKKGFSINEIMSNPESLTNAVLMGNLDRTKRFAPDTVLIWDTGIFDSAAFYQVSGVNYNNRMDFLTKYRYKGVILLEMIYQNKLAEDIARPQTNKLRRSIDLALRKTYDEAGYLLTTIPVMDINSRVKRVQSVINAILE
ncbi:MAG: ATP-binding protein [Anaerolineae bacterium]|nr:ATP-binding protein [Anaerolineae bacterium]